MAVRDSTWPRLGADCVVVLVIAAQAALGWRFGLIRRAFALAGTFAAVVAAWFAGNALAGLVRPNSTDADMASFIAVFLLIVGFFELLGALGAERLGSMAVVLFDRVTGALAGALLGVLQVAIAFLVTLSATANAPVSTTLAGTIRAATLSGAVVAIEPGVRSVLTPVLPAHLDLHLAAPPGG